MHSPVISMRMLIAVVLFVLLAILLYATLFSPRFRSQQLVAHLGDSDKSRFICPPGHRFFLAFGYATNQADTSLLRGQFVLSRDNTQIQQWTFDGANLDEANWLQPVGLSAFVLKADDPNHLLNVNPGTAYEITIQADNLSGVSLWLCYVTTRYQEIMRRSSTR